jgi:hypothetical protein
MSTSENAWMHTQGKWVADLMRADGVKPEQATPELALAYFAEVGRKIVKIQTQYLTEPGAAAAMRAAVFGMLKK